MPAATLLNSIANVFTSGDTQLSTSPAINMAFLQYQTDFFPVNIYLETVQQCITQSDWNTHRHLHNGHYTLGPLSSVREAGNKLSFTEAWTGLAEFLIFTSHIFVIFSFESTGPFYSLGGSEWNADAIMPMEPKVISRSQVFVLREDIILILSLCRMSWMPLFRFPIQSRSIGFQTSMPHPPVSLKHPHQSPIAHE